MNNQERINMIQEDINRARYYEKNEKKAEILEFLRKRMIELT